MLIQVLFLIQMMMSIKNVLVVATQMTVKVSGDATIVIVFIVKTVILTIAVARAVTVIT